MRLLAVADIHYSLPQFDWVLEIAADFDVVVLAGDHLELASMWTGGRRAWWCGNISAACARSPGL